MLICANSGGISRVYGGEASNLPVVTISYRPKETTFFEV